jgi:hypothetical protein
MQINSTTVQEQAALKAAEKEERARRRDEHATVLAE